MHAQHMDIILIFARTRDVGLCRPCLHEKKTDMEQFGKILIVDDNEDVLFALNLLLEPYAEKIKVAVTPDRIEHFMTTFRPDIILLDMNFSRDAISGQEGFDSLKQILSIDPQAVVIFMTATRIRTRQCVPSKRGLRISFPSVGEGKIVGDPFFGHEAASFADRDKSAEGAGGSSEQCHSGRLRRDYYR